MSVCVCQVMSVFSGWSLNPFMHKAHLAAGPSTLKFIRSTRADDGDGALHTKYGLVSSNKCEPDPRERWIKEGEQEMDRISWKQLKPIKQPQ